jgi:hypothetical protein
MSCIQAKVTHGHRNDTPPAFSSNENSNLLYFETASKQGCPRSILRFLEIKTQQAWIDLNRLDSNQ